MNAVVYSKPRQYRFQKMGCGQICLVMLRDITIQALNVFTFSPEKNANLMQFNFCLPLINTKTAHEVCRGK